jgi:hypothetical protein
MTTYPWRSRRASRHASTTPPRSRNPASIVVAVVTVALASHGRSQCQPAWVAMNSMGVGAMTNPMQPNRVSTFRVLPNGDLLLGGSFDSVGGIAANSIARWNGATWTSLGSGIDGGVRATAVLPNGDVIAGGTFASAGGVLATNVAQWDGTSWHALGAGVGDTTIGVSAVAVLPNGHIVVGGNFDLGGVSSRLAEWDGTTWSTIAPSGFQGAVSALAVLNDGSLVAGGFFATSGNPALTNIARWNGTSWSGLGTGANFAVKTLLVKPNGDLLAAGATNVIRSWNGVAWSTVGTGTLLSTGGAPSVDCLTLDANGDLIVGGRFDFAGGFGSAYLASNIAKWNGVSWSPLGSGFPNFLGPEHVYTLATVQGVLWAGGWLQMGIARWTCPNGLADWTVTGSACTRRKSFYETFNSGGFDLGNSRIQLVPTGLGYMVSFTGGAPSFNAPPVGNPDLGLGDDAVTPPITLPFSILYPGGVSNQIVIGSNGYVFVQPGTQVGGFYGDTTGFLGNSPRFAPMWSDLDPTSGTGSGEIHLEVDAINEVAYVTWMNIQEWGQPLTSSTFQVALSSSGAVEYRYLNCTTSSMVPSLVGWSAGGGAVDPGSIDLSNTLPFFTAQVDATLQQTATSRPALNTAWNLETREIPAGAVLGLEILGLSNPNIPDLAAIGVPGCGLFANLDSVNVFLPSGPTRAWSLSIPNTVGLIGMHIHATSAAWTVPSGSTDGLITANGIDGTLGVL